jgi:hypothetical protein
MSKIFAMAVGALALIAGSVATVDGAQAGQWTLVETLRIDGVAAAIPAQTAIVKRDYSAGGIYRFSLDPTAPGISYAVGYPKVNSVFVMVLDQKGPGVPGGQHSYGLNMDEGLHSFIHVAPTYFGINAAVIDQYNFDNSGYVNLIVEKYVP